MKKLPTLLTRLALILFGLATPLLILEVLVRLLGLAPPPIPNPNIWTFHAELGWWHTPNSGGTFYSSFNEYETAVQINGLGLRDDEHLSSYEAAADKFKVLVLVDSFGEALQVPLEATFYKQLENKLNDDGVATETINGGVGNWGTDQEATFYRLEGRKYKPDLTLLFFFTRNDTINSYGPLEIARNGGSIQKSFYTLDEDGNLVYPPPFDPETAYDNGAEKPKPLPPAKWVKTADWLWLNSHLYRYLVPYLRDIPPVLMALGPGGLLGGEGRIRATHPAVPLPFFVYQTPLSTEWEAAWQLNKAIISDLKQQVEADGGQFALVIIPAKEQVYPAEWEQTLQVNAEMQGFEWDLTLPNKELIKFAEEEDILYLDLLSAFEKETNKDDHEPLYFKHDGHWTEAGHGVAAEAVFEFLREEDLVGK